MKAVQQQGFTYLGVLIAIAIMGVALLLVSQVWSATSQRQKIEQLKWVGAQYKNAVVSYYYAGPSAARTLPRHLDELVEDRRFNPPKHHLRKLYPNPLTGRVDWSVVQVSERIYGVQTTESTNLFSFIFSP